MYSPHSLPPPSSFTSDNRPLRLTSNPSPPLPTGECRFILLHPSVQNQRCPCQRFHHNRNLPGASCDCGHQACYHVHRSPTPSQEPLPASSSSSSSSSITPFPSHAALADKVRKLEEALQTERQIRDAAIAEERRASEREIRILREAMHPFYRSEGEMKRKLVDLEDRLEGNYDDLLRLRNRVIAIDDASMALEKRVEEVEGSKSKRRRVSLHRGNDAGSENVVNGAKRGSSSSSPRDFAAVRAASSSVSPNGRNPFPVVEEDEPRSSGILNLVDFAEPPAYVPTPRQSTPKEEARSSGFLELSLATRLASKASAAASPREYPAAIDPAQEPARRQSPPSGQRTPLSIVSLLATSARPTSSISAMEKYSGVTVSEQSIHNHHHHHNESASNKRKRSDDLMPLHVLASLSAASSMSQVL